MTTIGELRASVIERNGRVTSGVLLYLYHYPHAVHGDNGAVLRFEPRVQRCALLLDDGRTVHFTVPHAVQIGG